MKNDIFLSLGTNIGRLKKNLDEAIDLIKGYKSIEFHKLSKYYKSTPVEYLKQNDFLNCILWVKTNLNVHSFFKIMQKIETQIGTQKTMKNGPRKIDIDIIFYANQVISTSDLQIPHPRMHDRKFVLIPMMELQKDFIHPLLGVSIEHLSNNLVTANLQKVEVYK